METAIAGLAGVLVAAALYLMLTGNLVRFLFGLALLSNAANLVIFAAGRLTWAAPPLIANGAQAPTGTAANALPQALILTAIVIGFGLLTFTLVLVYRTYRALGTVEADALRVAEPLPDTGGAHAPGRGAEGAGAARRRAVE
ncbi:MAG: Na+/H+ antiporter subunit C [Azospirillaceae bacterium]